MFKKRRGSDHGVSYDVVPGFYTDRNARCDRDHLDCERSRAADGLVGSVARQIGESARLLRAATPGAHDAAIRNNAPSGIRLLPDPVFTGINPTTGRLDSSLILASNRLIPIEPAPALLVRAGIDAISVNMDVVERTRGLIASAEARVLLDAARSLQRDDGSLHPEGAARVVDDSAADRDATHHLAVGVPPPARVGEVRIVAGVVLLGPWVRHARLRRVRLEDLHLGSGVPGGRRGRVRCRLLVAEHRSLDRRSPLARRRRSGPTRGKTRARPMPGSSLSWLSGAVADQTPTATGTSTR